VVAVTRTAVNPWPWSVAFGFNQAELVEAPTRWLVCSGQTSIGPDGQVQHAGDMAGQVAAAVDNLRTVLAAADMTVDDIVRITAYVTDMDAFIRVPRVLPVTAFTVLGVSRLGYPVLLGVPEGNAVA
jgi:enamine deaminase RidA (YjgF/YER057c/UK114 family)